MDGGGQGGGGIGINRCQDVVGNQDSPGPGADARGKGQKVPVTQLIKGPVIHGDACVGIHIAAITGKMLEGTADAFFVHDTHGAAHETGNHVRIGAERPGVNIIL